MKLLVTIILISFLSSAAFAKEFTLGKITSDITKDYALLVYNRDETTNEILGVFADSYSQGVKIGRQVLDETELDNGIVLLKKDQYEIVILSSNDFDLNRGGHFTIDTLYSAISGERRSYYFEILVDPDTVRAENSNGEFNRMHFVAKKSRILGPIGIEKIQFYFE